MNDSPDLPTLVRAEQSQLRLPSRPHWVEPLVEYLCQKAILCGACQESRSKKLLVALQEALVNAVVHGNLGLSSELKERDDNSFAEALAQRAADPDLAERSVDVLMDYDGQRCRWIISDQGNGFDFDRAFQRLDSDDPEVLLSSGRGILLMRSFMDEVKYENGGRRLILTLHRDSGDEKRQHARLESKQPVRVAPIRADGSVDWDAAYEAISVNFSEQGMGLLQQRLAGAERIIIGIYSNDQPIYIPAEVRHCRSMGGDIVELGCRFQARSEVAPATAASLPSQADLELALHQAIADLMEKHKGPPIAGHERRAHPRVVYNAKIEILRGPDTEPVVGFARDLSRGGISFITTIPLPSEVIVVLLPEGKSRPLAVRAQIVRCTRVQDGFFDVGANFLKLEDMPKG